MGARAAGGGTRLRPRQTAGGGRREKTKGVLSPGGPGNMKDRWIRENR